MNGNLPRLLVLLTISLLAGCHCMPWTEKYCDRIDDCSDRRFCVDRCYHSKLDLTRLGRSDGAACCRKNCR